MHPRQPGGVRAFLETVPGIQLQTPQDEAQVQACLKDGADILVTHVWQDAYLVPSLKWIASTSAGHEQFPLDRLAAHGVRLTTATGVAAVTVAEHAFALLLALTRRISSHAQNMLHRRWQPQEGIELSDKNLAIIGLGRIGEAIAVRASCWGMNVRGIKRNPKVHAGNLRDVRGLDALGEACAWADVVILCAPGSPAAPPIITARELDLLGAGYLVNVGRGSLVDHVALLEALSSGQLRGAGLDVTAPEPLPADSPLWASPKLVISAHSAGRGPDYGPRWGGVFQANLSAFKDDGPWTNLIRMEG